jgi:hypothetical protein
VLIEQVMGVSKRYLELIRDRQAKLHDMKHILDIAEYRACQAERDIREEINQQELAAKWRAGGRRILTACIGGTIAVLANNLMPGHGPIIFGLGAVAGTFTEVLGHVGEHIAAEAISGAMFKDPARPGHRELC